MSKFSIDTEAVKKATTKCELASETMVGCSSEILGVKDSLPGALSGYPEIGSTLEMCAGFSKTIGGKISTYAAAAVSIVGLYTSTEDAIVGNTTTIVGADNTNAPGNPSNPAGPGTPGTPGTPGNPNNPNNPNNPTNPANPGNPSNPAAPAGVPASGFFLKRWLDKAYDWEKNEYSDPVNKTGEHEKNKFKGPKGSNKFKDNRNNPEVVGWTRDKDTGKLRRKTDEELAESTKNKPLKDQIDPKVTIAGGSKSKSVYGTEKGFGGTNADGKQQGKFTLDAFKGEATAEAYASKKGIGASVGVTGTALTATAAYQLGTEMAGAHAEAGADFGRVGAKAEANLGLDKNGNFNAGVKASAEAIAAEARIKGGVDIAGAKIDATGAVNFGVGAHADVGLTGGKLKVDIGVSVGVGASVAVEIDVSKPIKAACDFVDSALNFFGW